MYARDSIELQKKEDNYALYVSVFAKKEYEQHRGEGEESMSVH